jgi:hypothetical protein
MIYLCIQGEQCGPYEKSQIEGMRKGEQITADTLYWHEGMPEWAAISGLFVDIGSMPPPRPMMPPTLKPERAKYQASTNTFNGDDASSSKTCHACGSGTRLEA